MKLSNLLLRGSKGKWYEMSLTARVRDKKIPNKRPANDTTELHWMFGRHVCQCKRITIEYCPQFPSSRGIRHWLDYEAHKFVAANPQIAVYAVEKRNKDPQVKATFMNGMVRTVPVPNHDDRAIWQWMERFRTESGRDWRNERLKKPWISTQPSIQGTWNPFLYKPVIDINPDNFMDDGAEEDEVDR